jgi:photosystem II stability/assembly factor-like uncharacterized protein
MLKKVIYILAIVILQFLNIYPQPTWEKIKTPTNFNLLKVCYLDSLNCWVAGDSGVIMFSADQGGNWQIQNSGVSNYISDIFFLNENLGWALTFEVEGSNSDIRSKILITSDGGSNWEISYYRNLNVILTTIYFQDSLNGWVGSKPSGISFTQDGGYSWFESTIDTGVFSHLPVEQIGFSSSKYGFAVGGHVDAIGAVWSTSDSGKIWMPHGIGPDLFLDYIFLDSTTVISLTAELEGYYPTAILKFNLFDNSWDYINTPEYVYVTGLSLRTPTEIWGTIGRKLSSFIVSNNSGKSWQLIDTPDSLITLDIDFADSLHGIAVGYGGSILKYIPEIPVSVESTSSEIPEIFILDQNYPNPFNPSTKISWQTPVNGWQTLKVYDVLGNKIATLVDEYKPAGNYEVEFNVVQSAAADIPAIASGIYFYQLKTENYFETKKMLLLK